MPKIEESCPCGATFKVEMNGWYAEVNLQRAVEKFREDHAICRAALAESRAASGKAKP